VEGSRSQDQYRFRDHVQRRRQTGSEWTRKLIRPYLAGLKADEIGHEHG
jgi:hypothetical protein